MGVATKVIALNVCTLLKSSQSVVADTPPLVIEKSGKSQGKVILLFIFYGNHTHVAVFDIALRVNIALCRSIIILTPMIYQSITYVALLKEQEQLG